jgi:hypothetical protein
MKTYTFSDIKLYRDTPFVDPHQIILFNNHSEKLAFLQASFTNGYQLNGVYNSYRDMGTLRLDNEDAASFNSLDGINYMSYTIHSLSGGKVDRVYYARCQIDYTNDRVTTLSYVLDVGMTYLLSDFANYFGNVQIERQHLPKALYSNSDTLLSLTGNDDIIQTGFKSIRHQAFHDFASGGNYIVLFLCSIDLSADFGKVDAPKTPTATGGSIDSISAPVNVYTVSMGSWNALGKYLQDFPWIAQGITKTAIIPSSFMAGYTLSNILLNNNSSSISINEVQSGKATTEDFSDIEASMRNVYSYLATDYDVMTQALATRTHYNEIRLTNNQGQHLTLDPAKLAPSQGLKFISQGSFSYNTILRVFPRYYNSNAENAVGGMYVGEGLDNSITWSEFDAAPLLINTGLGSWANGGYSRALNNSRQPSRIIANAANNARKQETNSNPLSAISNIGRNLSEGYAANGLTGMLTAAGGVAAGVSDSVFHTNFTQAAATGASFVPSEIKYWQDQKASREDTLNVAMSETTQTTHNALSVKDGMFGLQVKYYSVSDFDLQRVSLYHKSLGVKWGQREVLKPFNTMSIMNFVKFEPFVAIHENATGYGIPVEHQAALRQLFIDGVQLWHENNMGAKVFAQDLMLNVAIN